MEGCQLRGVTGYLCHFEGSVATPIPVPYAKQQASRHSQRPPTLWTHPAARPGWVPAEWPGALRCSCCPGDLERSQRKGPEVGRSPESTEMLESGEDHNPQQVTAIVFRCQCVFLLSHGWCLTFCSYIDLLYIV